MARRFIRTVRGVEVVELHNLLTEILAIPQARQWLLDRKITANEVGLELLADTRDRGTLAPPTPRLPAMPGALKWTGEIPAQKWMNFYTKVLSKFSATAGLKLTLRVEVAPAEGVSPQKVDETKLALRELGLKDSLEGE